MGLITLSLVILVFRRRSHSFLVIFACASALRSDSQWRMANYQTLGSKIYVCALSTHSARKVLCGSFWSSLLGGPFPPHTSSLPALWRRRRTTDVGRSVGVARASSSRVHYIRHRGDGGLILSDHLVHLSSESTGGRYGLRTQEESFSGNEGRFLNSYTSGRKNLEGLEALWNFAECGPRKAISSEHRTGSDELRRI